MDLLVPPFVTPHTPRINPHASLARDHLKAWSRQIGMVPDGPEGDRFDGVLLDRLAAWAYPYASQDKILLMADWMGWFFAFDDILDNTDEGRDQEFAAFVADTINSVHNSAPPPRHDPDVEPYRVAMKDLWTRTTTDMPRSWCRRLATDLMEYLNSYRTQALVNAHLAALSEDFYRAHRLASSAVLVSLDIGEAATGHPLSETLLVHPYVRVAREAANNVVSWVNDLYSAPKELGLGDLCNYVAVLQRQYGCSSNEATERVAAQVTQQTERFLQAEDSIHAYLIPHVAPPERQALRLMLEGLACWMNGNSAWSAETARYRVRHVANPSAGPKELP